MADNESDDGVFGFVIDKLTGGAIEKAKLDISGSGGSRDVVKDGDVQVAVEKPTAGFNGAADKEPSETDQFIRELYAKANRDSQYIPMKVDDEHPEGVIDFDKIDRIAEAAFKAEHINDYYSNQTNEFKFFALTPDEGKLLAEVSEQRYGDLKALSDILKDHSDYPVENLQKLDFEYKNDKGYYNLSDDFEPVRTPSDDLSIYEIASSGDQKGLPVEVDTQSTAVVNEPSDLTIAKVDAVATLPQAGY